MRVFLVILLLLTSAFSQQLTPDVEANAVLLRKEAEYTLKNIKNKISIHKEKSQFLEAIALVKDYQKKLQKYRYIIKESFFRGESQSSKVLLTELNLSYIKKIIDNLSIEEGRKSIDKFIHNSYASGIISKIQVKNFQEEINKKLLKIRKNEFSEKNLNTSNEKNSKIIQLMNKAKLAFLKKEYVESVKNLKRILIINPYHKESISLLNRAQNINKKFGDKRAEQSLKTVLLNQGWSAVKNYDINKLGSNKPSTSNLLDEHQNQYEKLLANSYIFKHIVFNKQNILEVIEILQSNIEKFEVPFNIIQKLDFSKISKSKELTLVTSPSDSLKDILEKVVSFFDLTYTLNNSIISIIHKGTLQNSSNYDFRSFNISKNFFEFLNEQEVEIKDYLIQSGVKFPKGSTIHFSPKVGKLFVRNSLKEIEKIHSIITNNKSSYQQCDIEAKILEISETIAQELNLTLDKRDSSSDILFFAENNYLSGLNIENNFRKGVQDLPNTLDAKGELHLLQDSPALQGLKSPNILTFDYVIGNFNLESTLRALKVSNYTSLISTPRAIVKDGEKAIVKVSEERYFLNSIDEERTVSARDNGGNGYDVTLPAHPIFGEPRELGIVFEVEPVINYDNYTINLFINPQILEFVKFENIVENTSGFDEAIVRRNLNFPQDAFNAQFRARPSTNLPILKSRSISTNLNLWDGENVSLGGITQSKKITIEDKIPILAEIPIIGRLFTREYEAFEKSELIFFVKASISKKSLSTVKSIPIFD